MRCNPVDLLSVFPCLVIYTSVYTQFNLQLQHYKQKMRFCKINMSGFQRGFDGNRPLTACLSGMAQGRHPPTDSVQEFSNHVKVL